MYTQGLQTLPTIVIVLNSYSVQGGTNDSTCGICRLKVYEKSW